MPRLVALCLYSLHCVYIILHLSTSVKLIKIGKIFTYHKFKITTEMLFKISTFQQLPPLTVCMSILLAEVIKFEVNEKADASHCSHKKNWLLLMF